MTNNLVLNIQGKGNNDEKTKVNWRFGSECVYFVAKWSCLGRTIVISVNMFK